MNSNFKMAFHRPPQDAVREHALRKALVTLVEQHRDEFNGYLADEISRVESIKCRNFIPFGEG